ncbi:concanavalin A-like lectin/glucanase domain-containing protein [Collybia nuda]|uniref:Concanavalin A-like lectin/glucanase domain-containing protein n=1 Tax=Collybia nuda TaxID=64659 RepID=A0A9P6CAS5_9AGAR|nr:concanavalin A-like lectin/glucanase domain-containing protein [Collybia nuda]
MGMTGPQRVTVSHANRCGPRLPPQPPAMRCFKFLPLNFILVIADSLPFQTCVSRSTQLGQGTGRRSWSFIGDLQVALSRIFVAQPRPKTAYCKLENPNRLSNIVSSGTGNATSISTTQTPSSTMRSSSLTPKPTNLPPASSSWKIFQTYEGNSFFDGWQFTTGEDKTHGSYLRMPNIIYTILSLWIGTVEYVDQNTARESGILNINSEGNAVMRVETTGIVPNTRKSIRITTNAQFDGGLVIMDSVHMPTGCATWPAFWTNGPNWPAGGEIDIVEGVHDYSNNQAAIHTNPGCTLPTDNTSFLNISGSVIGGIDCATATTGNQGCGIRASSGDTYGAGFNANGGGVYAMKWDATGVATYFFPRGAEPADITADAPQPNSWGTAQARWPSTSCDAFQFFNNHHVIFDTTLCGDWAGAVWMSSGIPGQEQSCAQRTGFTTCEAFVRANGSAFTEAYWEVKSVKIYQFSG